MKPFRKIYVEISNRCNLRCSFCPGTARPLGAMTEENFARLLPKLAPFADFLYFHLMGEPLCHPQLERFLELAGEAGFRVILTTNGTLLSRMQEVLLAAPALHKVNISLQAFEGSGMAMDFDTYLAGCFGFGQAAAGKKIVCYRLWNRGGLDSCNPAILRVLEGHFPKPWVQERRGIRLSHRVYLELGEKFDWPDLSAPRQPEKSTAMVSKTSWVSCGTARWSLAAWTTRGTFLWGMYFNRSFRRFSPAPGRRL